MRKSLFLIALTLTLAFSLSACGFKLRGTFDAKFAFETIYLALSETDELHAALKRAIESGKTTRIVGDPKTAQAIFSVVSDSKQKNILSLSGTGRVKEFQFVRTFSFRLHTAKGQNFLPPATIVIRRDMNFDDTLVLAKESEEAVLWRDIESDLVGQLMRRLTKAKNQPLDE
ncbi:MAG: LPS assembly lipoprotein LptE [Rhodocyclaceae bacterium]|nr:LPS assembly lipoprotein LptE [Rhodocyclaceae bacterium]